MEAGRLQNRGAALSGGKGAAARAKGDATMARRNIGYDHIVIILPDDERKVKRCTLPSPPPEEWVHPTIFGKLEYVGTIWETPHYKLRAETAV